MDEETNVVKYSRDGTEISIDYKLHRIQSEELDIDLVASYVEDNFRPSFCKAPDFRILSDKGFTFNLNYLDMYDDIFYNFQLDKGTCAQTN